MEFRRLGSLRRPPSARRCLLDIKIDSDRHRQRSLRQGFRASPKGIARPGRTRSWSDWLFFTPNDNLLIQRDPLASGFSPDEEDVLVEQAVGRSDGPLAACWKGYALGWTRRIGRELLWIESRMEAADGRTRLVDDSYCHSRWTQRPLMSSIRFTRRAKAFWPAVSRMVCMILSLSVDYAAVSMTGVRTTWLTLWRRTFISIQIWIRN